jgi:hypothetical protein
MAIPWLVVLKSVPWSDVISNAPKVVEGAKRLWNTVSGERPVQEPPVGRPDLSPSPEPDSESEALPALKGRIAAMESATAELHGQMLASTELIQSLADQNAQLIKHIEAGRMRIKWLTRAMVAVAIVALLGLALVVVR